MIPSCEPLRVHRKEKRYAFAHICTLSAVFHGLEDGTKKLGQFLQYLVIQGITRSLGDSEEKMRAGSL